MPAKTPATPKTLTDDQLWARLDDLSGKAQRGDKKAWGTLQPILEQWMPAWETTYESPAVRARRTYLDAVLRDNLLVQEAWERRACTMIAELAGPDPSPLERILCERVATCWLDVSLADLIYASRMKEGASLKAGEYY